MHRAQIGQPDSGDADGDDMGDTILGDVTHPAPIIMPSKDSAGKVLAALALGGILTGGAATAAGLAAYFLTKQTPAPVVQPGDSETMNLGLGKLEDYISGDP